MGKNNKTNLKKVFLFAGSIMAFIIGSGYASGQEVLRFYTTFGLWGIVGEFASMFLYAWIAVTLMTIGCENKIEGNEALKYYVGSFLGKIIDVFITVYIYTIFILMVSGAGATINQAFGIPTFLGTLIIILLALITVLLGLEKILDVMGCIGPVIGVFAVVVGVIGVITNFDGLINAAEIMSKIEVPRAEGVGNWLWSAVIAPASVLIGAIPFLTSMGASTDNKKNTL